ncbi:hypothetical protein [Thiomonas sp. FB-6]
MIQYFNGARRVIRCSACSTSRPSNMS